MTIHNNIQEYLDLNPKQYSFLKEIKFLRGEKGRYDAEIVMCNSIDLDKRIKFYCINACNISINDIEGAFGLLVDIIDIRDKQLELMKFKIVDIEEGAFSFFCNEFYIFSGSSVSGME